VTFGRVVVRYASELTYMHAYKRIERHTYPPMAILCTLPEGVVTTQHY